MSDLNTIQNLQIQIAALNATLKTETDATAKAVVQAQLDGLQAQLNAAIQMAQTHQGLSDLLSGMSTIFGAGGATLGGLSGLSSLISAIKH